MPLILHEMKKAYQIVIIDFSFSTISSFFLSCLQTIFQVLKSFGLNLNVLLNAESFNGSVSLFSFFKREYT